MSSTGITAPAGFTAAATTAGIKPSGNPDMALVVNTGPEYHAAAVFTRNRVVASPVKVSREAVADGRIRAVLFNAGNANACNGTQGDRDAVAAVEQVAQLLDVAPADIGVCSTGLIGEPMPMDKVHAGVETLGASLGDHGEDAAVAIMTTDLVKKETVVNAEGWTLGGMGKGVGSCA